MTASMLSCSPGHKPSITFIKDSLVGLEKPGMRVADLRKGAACSRVAEEAGRIGAEQGKE
jgi:hypothetical protein